MTYEAIATYNPDYAISMDDPPVREAKPTSVGASIEVFWVADQQIIARTMEAVDHLYSLSPPGFTKGQLREIANRKEALFWDEEGVVKTTMPTRLNTTEVDNNE